MTQRAHERWPQEAIDAAVHEMPGAPIASRNVLASAVRGLLDAGYVVVRATDSHDYCKALEEIATDGTTTDREIAARALGFEDWEHFDRRDLRGQ